MLVRLLRFVRPLCAVLILAVGAPLARGGLVESKDWIVESRAHRFLKALAENLGTDDTEFAAGHALAALSLSGCNLSVLVVGPIRGDAKAYARAVDAWRERQGFEGEVRWSQENDCAAAEFRYCPGHVGLKEGSTTVDLPALREALLKVEPHTRFAVTDAVWAKTDLGFPPDATTAQGTRYWDLTGPRPGLRSVVGTIRLAPWIPPLLLAWFLVPIVGVLGSFAVGVAIAKDAHLPLARRRRLYGRAVQGGTFGALGLHAVLFLATVPTRLFDPLAQLWFGQRFTQFAIVLVPLFAVVPMLALPFVNRVEKRLMGPSDEERLRQEAEPLPKREIVAPKATGFKRLSIVFLVVGIAIGALAFLLPKTASYRNMLLPLSLVVMNVPTFLNLRRQNLPKVAIDPETLADLDVGLKEHVARMASRLDMDAPPSRVLVEAVYGRFGAILDKKGVGVAVGAMEALAPGELDFLVAHELAHGKLGHLRKRRLALFSMFAACLLPTAVFLALGRASFATPGFIMTPMLVPIVVMLPYGVAMRRTMRRQEFEADALAVKATGDPETARLTLRKITLNSASPGVHDTDVSTHPTIAARLAAIV